MKKMRLLFSFFVCLTLAPQTGLASGSGNAQISQILNIATAGAAGVYSAQNFATCAAKTFGGFPYCVKGIMGALQMLQSIMGAANSGQTGADLVNGDYGSFTFDPVQSGFCFDTSTGCTQTAIDRQLSEFDTAFKTGEGYDEALAKLKAEAAKRLSDAEKKGYKVDTENGTITGPNGKTTSFAAAAAGVPKNFGAKAQEKFAGVVEQIENKNKKRGLASAGGAGGAAAGGGVAFQDEYYGGGKFGKKSGKKKAGKNKKNSLLASLTDKDAGKGGIGVAGDNIFGMVNRRYIKKTKSAEFFKK